MAALFMVIKRLQQRQPGHRDRKSTRLNSITTHHLVCRLLLEKTPYPACAPDHCRGHSDFVVAGDFLAAAALAALLCIGAVLGVLWLDGLFVMPFWLEDFVGYLWLIRR